MEELRKINARIKKQQIGKLVGGLLCLTCGAVLWGSYAFQEGITTCQKAIAKFYPDEYSSLTKKVVETVEKEGHTNL